MDFTGWAGIERNKNVQLILLILFCFAFRYRYKNDDLQTVETINNIITCDAEKKPDLYMNKPMNNCVAQLRENVVSIETEWMNLNYLPNISIHASPVLLKLNC